MQEDPALEDDLAAEQEQEDVALEEEDFASEQEDIALEDDLAAEQVQEDVFTQENIAEETERGAAQ